VTDRPILVRTEAEREQVVRRLFERARRSHPNWSHHVLLRHVWPRRPERTPLELMYRIAEEFRLAKKV
jgi:hypothetical protein